MPTTSTSSPPDGPSGWQRPRIEHIPPHTSSAGEEAIDLAKMAGLVLDPWQQYVLANALNERRGKWAAMFVGLCVPRQNGKGSILEARELAGLFLLGERLIIHTAHEYKTAYEAFLRLRALIDGNVDFSRRVHQIRVANGEVGVEMKGGARLRFLARSKGSGRGFSCDCLILDEAMFIPESTHGAILPTLSARPNPQVWYTGSAVDQEEHHDGIVFARVREHGIKGESTSRAYFEWSAPGELRATGNPASLDGEGAVGQANPGLGIRLNEDFVAAERGAMSGRKFAVERLGIGSWPRTDGLEPKLISLADWEACGDPGSSFDGVPCFSVDVNPDRTAGTIAVAGIRADGAPHVELVDHGQNVGWLVESCTQLQAAHKKASFAIQARGPAQALVADLTAAKIRVVEVSTADYAGACGAFYDAVIEHRLRYVPPQPEIEAALDGVRTRSSGDAWTWSRKDSSVDISPLVAVTLSLWGAQNIKPAATPAMHDPREVAARMVAEGKACGACLRRLNGADVCPECGWRREMSR